MKAALCEKVVWDGDDPFQMNEAIILKTACYREAGLFRDAAENLNRVRMYLLTPEQRKTVLVEKAECYLLCQAYDEALATLQEAGIPIPELEPKHKSQWLAMFLGFLVPAGYAYAGDPGAGLVSTALNAGALGWTVFNILDKCYVSGLLGGAFALYYTFYGAQGRIQSLVESYNSAQEEKAKSEAVRSALESISK